MAELLVDHQSVTCQMSGGPYDGVRCVFDFLPVLLLVQEPHGGSYQQAHESSEDGAHIFEYRPTGDRSP